MSRCLQGWRCLPRSRPKLLMTRSNWEVEDGAEPSLVNNCRQPTRNGGWPFKMGAKLRLSSPGKQCAARRLRSPFAKAHLFARQGGERAAERLMSSSWWGARPGRGPVQSRRVHIRPSMTDPAFPLTRILIITDAWLPQINGVVRSIEALVREAPALGVEIKVLAANGFRTVPLPTYPQVRVAVTRPGAVRRRIAIR